MRAILVHGLMGHADNCWFPWMKRELEKAGIPAKSIDLPQPAFPVREDWVKTLTQAVDEPADTILVGHSLGCPTILHYLQEYRGTDRFPQAVLVAGFGRRFLHERVSHLQQRLLHWLEQPLDFADIRRKCKKFTCLASTDDPLVPYAESVWLAEQLDAELVTEKKQHFVSIGGHGVTELPSALEAVLKNLEPGNPKP